LLLNQIANSLVYYVLAIAICILVNNMSIILRATTIRIVLEIISHEADVDLI
jgi:hypothetical protein